MAGMAAMLRRQPPGEASAMDLFESQAKSLTPPSDFSRRRFVVTSLAAGVALALQPGAAQTLATDSDATVAWAHKQKQANTRKLAVTGFCWGGRQTWLYAIHNPHVKAAVAWYGPVAGTTDPLHPKRVLDLLTDLKVPVLGLYGAAGQGIAAADVAKLRDEAKRLHKKVEIVIYPDTPHGFNADYRPNYRPEPATHAR